MKKAFLISFALCAPGFFLFAGGTSDRTLASRQETEPVYSIMVPLTSAEAPARETSIWASLEKLANARLDIRWIPSDYDNILNVSIAAGELPHCFVVTEPKGSIFVSAAQSNMFWEISDAIKNSQNISRNLDPKVTGNLVIGGKNYILPRGRMMVRYGFNYRKDWADKLGLKPPTNLSEIYDMLKAFATQDPDGNGRHDTFGMATAKGGTPDVGGYIWMIEVPVVLNGGGMGWVEEGGRLVPTFMTKQYIEILRWYKRLYDEKLINQDFAAMGGNGPYEMCNAEQAGAFFHTTDKILNRVSPLLGTLQLKNSSLRLEDVWTFVTDIKSPDGSIRLPADAGHWGGMVFPKTKLKTQAEFQKVFDIFDSFESEEGKNLITWGIEGVNYRLQDGKAVVINEDKFGRDVEVFRMGLSVTGVSVPCTLQGLKDPLQDRIETTQAFNARYGIPDLTYPFVSQTKTTRGAELDKTIGDAAIQWVMGQIDEAGYMAAIERWKASGGQAVMDEFTAAWRANR
jgi:putative aldouronate transport system substrate-binding protein